MRKYLFGIVASLLAILLNSFIVVKKSQPKTLPYRFVFTGFASIQSDISETNSTGNYYLNWYLDYPETISCNLAAQQIPCAIEVDEKYTHMNGPHLVLNSSDPDGMGLKMAFPMSSTAAFQYGCTQFYIVNTGEIPTQIDIQNATLE